jgi:polysaccharide biosynthesis transport protein
MNSMPTIVNSNNRTEAVSANSPSQSSLLPASLNAGTQDEQLNVVAALWRYRWAALLPGMAGCLVGFLVYLQSPDVYRSTTRLLIESANPTAMDAVTGELYGGVPSLDVVQSEIYSDNLLKMAFESPEMEPYRKEFSSMEEFVNVATESLVVEPEVMDVRSAQSLVFLLHFESNNRDLCGAAVGSFSDSLQTYYNKQKMNSRGEFINVIQNAMESLHPRMIEQEERYRAFRRDAALAWDSNGQAINPHRERQLFLVERRSELLEQQRKAEIELTSIHEIAAKSNSDPQLALNVIGQLLGKSFELPRQEVTRSIREADDKLSELEFDQSLVPLIIERNKYEAQYGANHPTVKELDRELDTMKNELRELVRERTNRIAELSEENSQIVSPAALAKNAVNAIFQASKAQVDLLTRQVKDLDEQITKEKAEAARLAQAEQENESQLREIARTRELFDDLGDKLAQMELVEEEGGVKVIELKKPTQAYQIGPSITKSLGLGTFLGLALGAALAILLETKAKTFRDPAEISESLGLPIIAHVPSFKTRAKKMPNGEVNPLEHLDPQIAVAHDPTSVAAEAIRSLRTSVFFELRGESGKIIQVSSALPGEGKTVISSNLATSIAQSGKRILAIDCDLRKPRLSSMFAMEDQLGLTDVLTGKCDWQDACHASGVDKLDVMPCGPIPHNPSEALTLPEMGSLFELLRSHYDYIIVDTPPLLVVSDPSIVASMVDAVVMTIRIRRKSRPNSKESLGILRAAGARVIGVVINNSDESTISDGYQGYGYYKYGRYTSRYATGKKRTSKRRTEERPVVVSGQSRLTNPDGFASESTSNHAKNRDSNSDLNELDESALVRVNSNNLDD